MDKRNYTSVAEKIGMSVVIFLAIGIITYTMNVGIWRTTTSLANGYYLRFENPRKTITFFSQACTSAPNSIQMDACELSIQLMLETPFRFYGQGERQAFLATLEQNLKRLSSNEGEQLSLFQIKHSITLAQGYEMLYRETKNRHYLEQEKQILQKAQERNPNILPLYRLASTMYEFLGETKEYFQKAPPELRRYLHD